MADIKTVADRVMNLYFQDYANGAEFFVLDDFVYYVGAAYAELLAQEFDKARAEYPENSVAFSSDWLISETLKLDNDDDNGFFLQLSNPVMSFPYDKRNSGIQNIFPSKTKLAGEYIRSTVSEIWMNELLPNTNKVYWALIGDKILLSSNLRQPPEFSKVLYVPGISAMLNIPDARVNMVTKSTIMMMREASRNHVIKETNDQNLNPIPQTESDSNLIKR